MAGLEIDEVAGRTLAAILVDKPMTGGCACGAVRYQLKNQPWDAGWCHCRTCQL